MLKDKYKIILIKENHFELKQYCVSFIRILLILSVFILFISANVYFFSGDILNYFEFKEIQSHRSNNIQLLNTLQNQNDRLEKISNLVDSLKNQEEKFRKLVKLPTIHKEIKQLGVSRTKDQSQSLNNLEYLLPDNIIKLTKTARNIDDIYRLINFEMLSYDDILKQAEENLKKIIRYPAIHPVDITECHRSSGYGYRRDPFPPHKMKMHDGVDYSGNLGTPIYATADGKVRMSTYYSSFGNYIEIDHGYGYKTCYGHLSKRTVKRGERVERGQKIGEMGNTGKSTATHLHYEIQLNRRTENPNKYFFDISNLN